MTTFASIFESAHFRPTHSVGKMRGLVLILVAALHFVVAIWLLQPVEPTPKKPPQVIEVVVLKKPEPVKVEPVKEPPPAPVMKKEPIKPIEKPKPIVVKPPEPVKKVAPPKPIAQPKVLTTVAENAETNIPKFESAPVAEVASPSSPVVTKTTAKPVEVSGRGQEEATSGGNCGNCSSIEKQLQRRYARRNFSGSISFVFTIGENGMVRDASIKNTEPADMFDAEILSEVRESLMEMEFEPKIVNGKAVSFNGTKTIKFQLPK
jgi:outer membrane biosynthesis protein TonB